MIAMPSDYQHHLSLIETELAIKAIKDTFEDQLSLALNLIRVSAPLFVSKQSGLNDNLSGKETPVAFAHHDIEATLEIVQSLAKWKRWALKRYGFNMYQGLYTDMNAIRKDEELDGIHSMFVDQWDWELIIDNQDRSIEFLKETVKKIYQVLLTTAQMVKNTFNIDSHLPKEIYFIDSQTLEDMYKDKSPKEREYCITKEYGAVFIMKIGDKLASGSPHDFRAPDYDDWQLNGDILVYYPLLDAAIELSSMGIRVNKEALIKQCELSNTTDRLTLSYHQQLINNQLPLTIGGGIGQSRMCLVLLNKAHIGEVQASTWPQAMVADCEAKGIFLL